MIPPANIERYKNHRFPGEIISHGVWLYYRFPLSYRDVQELLCERGIDVTHETIRQRSYWIPGSWHVRMMYTDAIPFHDPSQESDRAGQHSASHRRGAVFSDGA